jgi:hypothetical protein
MRIFAKFDPTKNAPMRTRKYAGSDLHEIEAYSGAPFVILNLPGTAACPNK